MLKNLQNSDINNIEKKTWKNKIFYFINLKCNPAEYKNIGIV